MKPNFALSLSFEGIKLLHRAAGGWREVGEVAISADDMAGELAVLRKTAASLEPGGVRSKLLIPASQIKYLTIDTPGLSDVARRKEAENALHDATPYEIADLAYDISIDGAKTHIAAVARETLDEAEAFATEHKFNPVSFVAVPEDAPYLGEPFFGTTSSAVDILDAGETVEPDGIAVVVVGAIAADDPAPEPEIVTQEPEPEADPAPKADAVPEKADAPEKVETKETAEPPKETSAPDVAESVKEDAADQADAKPEADATSDEPAKDEKADEKPATKTSEKTEASEKSETKSKPEPAAKPDEKPEAKSDAKTKSGAEPADDEAAKASTPVEKAADEQTPLAKDDAKPAVSAKEEPTPQKTPAAEKPASPDKPEVKAPPAPQPELDLKPVPEKTMDPKPAPPTTKPEPSIPSAEKVATASKADAPKAPAPPPPVAAPPPVAPVSAAPTPEVAARPPAPEPAPKATQTADTAGIPPAARAAALAAAAATPRAAEGAFTSRKAPPPAPPAPAPSAPAPTPEPAVATTGFTSRRSAPEEPAKPLGGAQRGPVTTPLPDSSSLTQPPPTADPEPAPVAKKGGFLSRRKPRKGAAAPVPAATATVQAAGTEAERMTVFGARTDTVGGKPRFLGLIMTVVLLVFLAGVAAWAAVFLDDGIAGLMKNDKTRATASAPENQIDPEVIRTPDGITEESAVTEGTVEVAALDPVLSAEDTAVVDALQDPRPEPQRPVITEAEAAARYAVTGIWPLAPETPLGLPDDVPTSVYRNSVDGAAGAIDAIALPAPRSFDTDTALGTIVSPPPFGQQTALNAAGLMIPTPEGLVTPQGYTLVAASPPIKPPATLTRAAAAPSLTAAISALAAARPQNRPLGLAERTERANLGGVSRIELAAFRPSLRPRSLQDRVKQREEAEKKEAAKAEEAEAARAAAAATAAAAAALTVPVPDVTEVAAAAVAPAPTIINATRFATPQSKRPDTRPRNFARIVKRAQREAPKETRVAAAASVAPRTVAPKLPSKASVARSATVKNALNLRKVNLIGVYGKPSSRRALVRLSNGRYKKVRVGDRIDGGRVSAISSSELRYSKGGRSVRLKMP